MHIGHEPTAFPSKSNTYTNVVRFGDEREMRGKSKATLKNRMRDDIDEYIRFDC